MEWEGRTAIIPNACHREERSLTDDALRRLGDLKDRVEGTSCLGAELGDIEERALGDCDLGPAGDLVRLRDGELAAVAADHVEQTDALGDGSGAEVRQPLSAELTFAY